jgi:hypothetical protein
VYFYVLAMSFYASIRYQAPVLICDLCGLSAAGQPEVLMSTQAQLDPIGSDGSKMWVTHLLGECCVVTVGRCVLLQSESESESAGSVLTLWPGG